jgi:hypothetical protein
MYQTKMMVMRGGGQVVLSQCRISGKISTETVERRWGGGFVLNQYVISGKIYT